MYSASVVITTKNRREDLLKAVESAMTQRGLLEVVVIDDGSTDGTAEELKKKFSVFSSQFSEEEPATSDSLLAIAPAALCLDSEHSTLDLQSADKPQLRLIRHEVSAGYIVRRNEAARLAEGEVIFSLDDDAVFSSPFVVQQTLQDFSHLQIGAVAIPYIEPHKANTEIQRAPTQEDVWITASYIGTAHALRRDVFMALGGYREHLVHQGEEGDFCLRMLAAEHEGKGILTTIKHGGGCEKEQPRVGPKGEGVGTSESKDSESTGRDEGARLDKPSGAAFSNPSASELARDPEITSLARSASVPDSLPASSHSPPDTALEVSGFFVRLGNSDPIIHNESPKRDYSRMDFYGRRNDVLFHWQNTPMPDIFWQLPKTIAGGVACAAKVGRWRKMLEGIGAGFMAIASGAKREPVPKNYSRIYQRLKKIGHVRQNP